MVKALRMVSVFLIVLGVCLFLVDFLPVNLTALEGEDVYMKIVPDDTFSIVSYRLAILITGVVVFMTLQLKAALDARRQGE
ncbi:hypothetical protein [Pseudoalteromonas obscura]|uniref:Uncharacterized protein n=1 Tax=Pseudoalteromonas obscura TaxID=3048491 RepID=A0ABT7EP28_9GAMM|nr:hypothetical protein [Pseudoalteromonas sp. P94(2023)]MDK2596805.1 hypothetical protein [Pseudoalteromonas sp. P94(2023)]